MNSKIFACQNLIWESVLERDESSSRISIWCGEFGINTSCSVNIWEAIASFEIGDNRKKKSFLSLPLVSVTFLLRNVCFKALQPIFALQASKALTTAQDCRKAWNHPWSA